MSLSTRKIALAVAATHRHLSVLSAGFVLAALAACNGGSDHPRLDLRAQKLIDGSAAAEPVSSQVKRLGDIMGNKIEDHISVSRVVGETTSEALPTFDVPSSFAPLCENAKCEPRNLLFTGLVRASAAGAAVAGSGENPGLVEDVLKDATGAVRGKGKDTGSLVWASDETLGAVGRGANPATFVTKDDVTVYRQTSPHNALGGVLNHSAFASFVKKGTVGDAVSYTARYGLAGGDPTGSRPVKATWKGVMVGHTRAGGDELLGVSTLTYDANRAAQPPSTGGLDVSFTDIKNLTKNRAHAVESINIRNMSVGTDGVFGVRAHPQGAGVTEIKGAFYGPDHAESAGSLWYWNDGDGDFTGAFGAKRQ